MKLSNVSGSLLLVLSLVVATSALAANSGSMEISSAAMVNGKQLSAGAYQLKWDGSSPEVQVNILKGRTVVATVPARLIDLKQSPSANAVVMTKNADGSRSVSEVRFGGKKYALALGGDSVVSEGNEASK